MSCSQNCHYQERKLAIMYMYVVCINVTSVSRVLRLNVRTVPAVWQFVFFILIPSKIHITCYINPRTNMSQKSDIGRGLIQRVIRIMICITYFINIFEEFYKREDIMGK